VVGLSYRDLLDSTLLAGSSLLCPTKDNVKKLNEDINGRLPGEDIVYLSLDKILQSNPYAAMTHATANARLEYVNTLSPGNLPDHKLTLRIGSVVMLTRNLSLAEGLCNGTRLQVLRTFPQMLECLILTGPRAGRTTLIGKTKFEHGKLKKDTGIPFSRYQFPLRLSFAMTINKAQGEINIRPKLKLNHLRFQDRLSSGWASAS